MNLMIWSVCDEQRDGFLVQTAELQTDRLSSLLNNALTVRTSIDSADTSRTVQGALVEVAAWKQWIDQ